MGRVTVGMFVFILILISPASTIAIQEPQAEPTSPGQELIRVFLDCSGFFCDFDHLRREVRFVDWVRDRQDADVHVLGTSQRTGSGGQEVTLAFIGQRAFAGREDTLRHVSAQTDTQDERRTGLTRTLALGLVRYVAQTSAAERLNVTYAAPATGGPTRPVQDPWDYWTFRTSIGGFFFGEKLISSLNMNGSISASRTTEDLKVDFSVNGSYSRDKFPTTVNIRRNFSLNSTSVWSLGTHWSAGFRASASGSTFLNQDLAVRGGPALEYNLFDYGESNRRQLTILYSVGPAVFDYDEETIFDQTAETLGMHTFEIALAMTQRWGSANTSLIFSQFLRDPSKHNLEVRGGFNIRLFRGLSFRLNGNAARVKDQLYLPKGELTTEETLLRRRQLGTDFRYGGSIGVTYSFGSIFNNVVNPRFEGASGGGFFFFN